MRIWQIPTEIQDFPDDSIGDDGDVAVNLFTSAVQAKVDGAWTALAQPSAQSTPSFALNEALGLFTYGDLIDASGNILSGTLEITDQYSVPGYDLESLTGVTEISFPNLIRIDPNGVQGGYLFIGGSGVVSISMPAFVGFDANGEHIQLSNVLPSLVSFNIPSYVPKNNNQFLLAGAALNATSVNMILARHVANAAYVSGVINLSGGTSAAPTGQGIADKATLIGRGVTVNTN